MVLAKVTKHLFHVTPREVVLNMMNVLLVMPKAHIANVKMIAFLISLKHLDV